MIKARIMPSGFGSGIDSPDPGLDSPDPGLDSPDPSLDSPDPSLDSPDPGLHSPDPSLDSPNPGLVSPDLTFEKKKNGSGSYLKEKWIRITPLTLVINMLFWIKCCI